MQFSAVFSLRFREKAEVFNANPIGNLPTDTRVLIHNYSSAIGGSSGRQALGASNEESLLNLCS
jgi:hypothetical protein